MKQKNMFFIKTISAQLSEHNIAYRFIDSRWKKRGDIDIIVAKKDISAFEDILKKNGFRRKGFWPPQSRSYKAFHNHEIISLGAHVGGYIGGFGGGLGRLGKKLNPNTSLPPEKSILSTEERLFILLYKYGSRKQNKKYEEEFNQLLQEEINITKLTKLCSYAFKNCFEIIENIQERKKLSEISLRFTNTQKWALFFRGKPNKILKRAYKVVKPSPYITIIGCSGSGKSTTVKNLVEKLRQENIETVSIYSGRIQFRMLPINFFLKLLKPDKIEGKKIEKEGAKSTQEGKEKQGTKEQYAREVRIFNSSFLNNIAPFVYYVEYLLRYFVQVHPKRIFNDIVITDRGYIDLFASPNMNKKMCSFFFKILPKPKHILLWNDPGVLAERRQEFRIEDLEKQLQAYDRFSALYLMKIKTDNLNIVDAITQKIEKMV